MGQAAGELSDLVILTSDNPRSEDPLQIMNDALVGLRRTDTRTIVEPDRATAIRKAIEEAHAGDIVILAGKGHETYQISATAPSISTIAKWRAKRCGPLGYRQEGRRANDYFHCGHRRERGAAISSPPDFDGRHCIRLEYRQPHRRIPATASSRCAGPITTATTTSTSGREGRRHRDRGAIA